MQSDRRLSALAWMDCGQLFPPDTTKKADMEPCFVVRREALKALKENVRVCVCDCAFSGSVVYPVLIASTLWMGQTIAARTWSVRQS